MRERMIHDVAWEAAADITNVFSALLYEQELKDAHEEVYRQVRLALEKFALMQQQEVRRLKALKGDGNGNGVDAREGMGVHGPCDGGNLVAGQ